MNWFQKRFSEPTTYIGLSLLANGAMVLTKADPQHTQAVTETLVQAAQPLAAQDWGAALSLVIGGLAAVFMSEKGKN
tara:strand:+ start:104 stop:334 length:231 start_codon:yes stop_codon:yes gene_type:complete